MRKFRFRWVRLIVWTWLASWTSSASQKVTARELSTERDTITGTTSVVFCVGYFGGAVVWNIDQHFIAFFLGLPEQRWGPTRAVMKYGNKNCTWEMFCLSLFRRRTVFTWHLRGFVEMLQTNVLTLCKVKNYETCLSEVKATAHSLLFFVFCLLCYRMCFQKFRLNECAITEIQITQEGSHFTVFLKHKWNWNYWRHCQYCIGRPFPYPGTRYFE
jgi:hypothetical protein